MLVLGGFKAAKQRVLDDFERSYMLDLVGRYSSLAAMSRVSGISPQQLRALLDKHGLPRPNGNVSAVRAGPR